MKPLISILIPNYNRGKYIAKAIQSALDQTYKKIEIIVVDNCSTDHSWNIIKSFRKNGVKIYKNPLNIGPTANFNECIRLAKGKYIKILHSDDMFEKDAVRKQVSLMEQHPKVGLVYGSVTKIDENGRELGLVSPFDKGHVVSGKEELKTLLKSNYIFYSAAMIRTECLKDVGLFDPEIPFCNDWDLWMRICIRYDIGYIKDVVGFYRVHPESSNLDYIRTKTSGLDQYKCLSKISSLVNDDNIKNIIKAYYYKIAREQIAKGLSLAANGNVKHGRKDIATSVIIYDSFLFSLAAYFFYCTTYLGKYPSIFFLKLGRVFIKS